MKGFALTTTTKKKLRVMTLFLISMIFVFIAASVAVIGCNYIGNRNFKETFYNVGSLKVNNKIRVVQISDLHSCSYGTDNDKIISRVRQLNPDLIIYTGDIVDVNATSEDDVINLCKELADVAPSYYIYGNNEVDRYYDVPLTQEALDKKYGFNNDIQESEQILELVSELAKKLEASGVDALEEYGLNDDVQDSDDLLNLLNALTKEIEAASVEAQNEAESTDNTRDPGRLLEVVDDLTKKLEAAGVKVLKNSSDTIMVGTTPVDVYGVLTSNPSSFWSYAGESFDKFIYSNENHLKITAIHEPLVFEEYFPYSWGDLMLAGHNHGGIVKIPMVGPLYTHEAGLLPERSGHYVVGRYEVQGSPLIISAGLENNDIMRINNEPELVIVDINKF